MDNSIVSLNEIGPFGDLSDASSLSPVTRYVYVINEIAKRIGVDPNGEKNKLFFRGQADIDWRVEPSIFRDNYLSIEHDIIRSSISRNPEEFVNEKYFTQLTKLQHYGLPTRLLDVTHNPLVALYFACAKETKKSLNDKGIETEVACDGAVYISYANPVLPESMETQVLSYIAQTDLSRIGFNALVETLKNDIKGLDSQLGTNSYESMLRFIRNHFVLSDMNHERIIRQSGAFLLCGCINFEKKYDDYKISKASADIESEFAWKISIDADEKDSILDELDFLNINEATLFPELEHQLSYIKTSNKKRVRGVNTFVGLMEAEDIDREEQQDTQAFLVHHLSAVISTVTANKFVDDISAIFIKNANIDWHKRNSIQAKLINEINRFLVKQPEYTPNKAKEIATMIVNNAVKAIYKKS